MKIAIIVAGGKGGRFGGDIPKQYKKIGDEIILSKTVKKFLNHPEIDCVQVVIKKHTEDFYKKAVDGLDKKKLLPFIYGGKTYRQESVYEGLKAIKKHKPDCVLIHDAVRPFVSTEVIDNVLKSLQKHDAVLPSVKIVDSVKKNADGFIAKSIDRDGLSLAQTPQGFLYEKIFALHEKYNDKNLSDDVALFEFADEKVKIVEGDLNNFKITTMADLKRAEAFIKKENRVGFGYDVHKFTEGDYVILGGVRIPHTHSLLGHSDADVVMHAITDALLGAIGEGDIGEHFPPSEEKWKNGDSKIFLQHATELMNEKNGKIINVDLTIAAEEPKLSTYKVIIKNNLSQILNTAAERINIKATTTEGLGFVGRKEGMAAKAIVAVAI